MATQALPPFQSAQTFTFTTNGVVSTGISTVLVTSALSTQALPPYLSASTFIVTSGGVDSTGVTTVGVPITYFGPSIPLGPDDVWTFGGSTSPASTSQSPTTTAIPSSSSQSNTSGVSAPSTTAGPSSALSSSSISGVSPSSPSGSGTSTSATATSVPVPTSSATGKSTVRRALPGIIIASIVVAVVLIMLLCLWRYRRKRRFLALHHPNLSDFVIVDEEGQDRVAGEGIPRTTGEEEDSFLRRSGSATDGMQEVGTSARLVSVPSGTPTEATTGTTMPPEGIVPSALRTSKDTSPHSEVPKAPSPFFHASASSLFFNPTRGPDPTVVGATSSDNPKRDSASTRRSSASVSPITIGNIIPPRQLLQIEDQWRQEGSGLLHTPIAVHHGTSELGERTEDYPGTPLRPPPVLNPDAAVGTRQVPRPDSIGTAGSHPESPGYDLDERATLLTARRVNLNDSTLINAENGSGPASWGSSLGLGLGGLTRLSRLSWFQRMEALRTSSPGNDNAPSRPNTPQPRTGSATSRASLHVPRPLSHLSLSSAKSSTGDTLFYDALSSISTRSGHGHTQRPSSMPPLPLRAVGHASAPHTPPGHDSGSGSNGERPARPSPVRHSPARSREHTPPNSATAQGAMIDILDTPVPAAVSPFSTSSSRGGPVLPPGLEHLSNVRSWRESSSDMPSAASFGTGSGHGVSVDVVSGGSDILEESPPRAREGWSHLRAVTGVTVDTGRRTTLGQPVLLDLNDDYHDRQHISERGSLHSIPERLSPFSQVASGSNSRAPSRHTQYGSSGSSSRYSSHQSHTHSGPNASGSGSQLHHSNSIGSDGQRRPRREPGEPISSPGSSLYGRARLSAIGGRRSPIGTPQRSPPFDATFSSALTGATTTTSMSDISGHSHTTRTTFIDPITNDAAHVPGVQWPANDQSVIT